jgi:hypothetical protein
MKHLLQESSNYDESHNPALPDKKKPWCLNCRLHTDWYSVYVGQQHKQTRTLRCKVCDGGDIYCPISPTKSKLISIAIVIPFLLLGSALITNGFNLAGGLADGDKLIGGLVSIALGILFAYLVRTIGKNVSKHWEEFHKWAEEQSEN